MVLSGTVRYLVVPAGFGAVLLVEVIWDMRVIPGGVVCVV